MRGISSRTNQDGGLNAPLVVGGNQSSRGFPSKSIVYEWNDRCIEEKRDRLSGHDLGRRTCYENEITGFIITGWKLDVCGHSRVFWNRIWRIWTWILRPTAASASSRDVCRSRCSGTRVRVGARILLSGRTSLLLASRILGTASVCRSVLGWTKILRTSLLFRPLAPVSFRTELRRYFNRSNTTPWEGTSALKTPVASPRFA